MDFCTSFFGKPLANLTYDDIVQYFTVPRIENVNIEFKSYAERSTFDDGLQKVIRGISSFLNSNGGVLLWGAPAVTKSNDSSNEVFVGVIKFHKIESVRNINGVFNGYSLAVSVGLFNFTELQNEETVFFRLLCVGGFFQRGNGAIQRTTSPMYINGASELIFENFADVLHFGTPRIHVDQIAFNAQTSEKTGGLLHLILSFGGKKSPAKMSHYTLDLNDEINFNNPNALLTKCEENILFADTAKKLNKSKEDSLNAFTER